MWLDDITFTRRFGGEWIGPVGKLVRGTYSVKLSNSGIICRNMEGYYNFHIDELQGIQMGKFGESTHRTFLDWFQITLYIRVLENVKKWMKKPIFGARFFINFWYFKRKIITKHPSLIRKCIVLFNLILFSMLMEKCAPPFFHFSFWFGSNPKTYLSVCRALILNFILIHTLVRRISTYYIIIYTIKNHYFTRTSVLNSLMILLSFLV